ncbi:MAG: peptidase M20, partial [Sphaerotilus sp.]|nr:peptidase M20 [Sphaerotilus sp.]
MNAPDRLLRPDAAALGRHVDDTWNREIVRELHDYIAIPAKSPMFDADWAAHGHLDTVVRRAADWVTGRRVPGLTLETVRLTDEAGRPRTPVLLFEVAATRSETAVGVA